MVGSCSTFGCNCTEPSYEIPESVTKTPEILIIEQPGDNSADVVDSICIVDATAVDVSLAGSLKNGVFNPLVEFVHYMTDIFSEFKDIFNTLAILLFSSILLLIINTAISMGAVGNYLFWLTGFMIYVFQDYFVALIRRRQLPESRELLMLESPGNIKKKKKKRKRSRRHKYKKRKKT